MARFPVSPDALFGLSGRRIMVCGASRGIGKAIAEGAAALGASLVLVGRNAQPLREVAQTFPEQDHRIIAADLSSDEGRHHVAATAPQLDGLVMAAGSMGKLTPFHLLQEEDISEQVADNVVPSLLLLQQAIARRKLGTASSVVLVGSVGAATCQQASAAYTLSRAAVIAGLRSAALDVARRGIRVNYVNYGYVGTAALDALHVSEERIKDIPLGLSTPEDAAGAALFLLCQGSRWMTRGFITADGGVALRQSLRMA